MIRIAFSLMICLMPAIVHSQEDVATFGAGPAPLVLRSTTDIAVVRPLMERFARDNPDLTLTYEQWGSNALFANSRAACDGNQAPADAVLSSAVQHMVWLVNSACARAYQSPQTAALPATRRWRNELWGITEEPAVILYNREAINGANVPRTRFALLDLIRSQPDSLRGRIATYDIQASGLGFLFAHTDSLEATTFGAMLEAFSRVDAIATCCSAEIISGVAEGRFHIAYNVLGSYVAGAHAPQVGVILPEDYTVILSRGFMVPKNAPNPDAANRLLDFLLSDDAQGMLETLGLAMAHDPSENGLLPSARRLIGLSPALLVALDQHKRARLFDLWQTAFHPDAPL